MARVIKPFCDKVTWRTYRAGDFYEGVRVDELAALGYVAKESVTIEPAVDDEPTTDYESMTKAQLTELAKERGIVVPKGATKGAIIELLRG